MRLSRFFLILKNRSSVSLLAWFVTFGVIFYTVSLFWVGWKNISEAFFALGLEVLLVGVVFSCSSYLWRFLRWDYSLKCLEYSIPRLTHFLIYLSGLALTATPGKSGETFRSILLLNQGVRVSHSLGAFFADRGSDLLGMILLGGLAAASMQHTYTWVWLIMFIILSFGSLIFAKFILRFWSDADRTSPTGLSVRLLIKVGRSALHAWAELWTIPRTILFSAVAIVAYGTQALIFAWFCHILAAGISIAAGILIFVKATLFGAATLIPAGLGTMEAAIVYQLMEYGVQLPSAMALAISIRLVTLWFGLLLGAFALLALQSEKHSP